MQTKSILKTFATVFVIGAFSMGAVAAEVVNIVPGHYDLDKTHAYVGFSVGHLGFSKVVGRFNTFSGEFKIDPAGESSAQVQVQAASVDTNNAQRDDHLRKPDFFNVQQFPTVTFESTKVNFGNSGQPISIEGNLTLLGQTHPVVLDVQPVGAGTGPRGKTHAGFSASTVIDRTQFGMNYNPLVIGKDVTITIEVEGIKR